jgi:hypothetical protein
VPRAAHIRPDPSGAHGVGLDVAADRLGGLTARALSAALETAYAAGPRPSPKEPPTEDTLTSGVAVADHPRHERLAGSEWPYRDDLQVERSLANLEHTSVGSTPRCSQYGLYREAAPRSRRAQSTQTLFASLTSESCSQRMSSRFSSCSLPAHPRRVPLAGGSTIRRPNSSETGGTPRSRRRGCRGHERCAARSPQPSSRRRPWRRRSSSHDGRARTHRVELAADALDGSSAPSGRRKGVFSESSAS